MLRFTSRVLLFSAAATALSLLTSCETLRPPDKRFRKVDADRDGKLSEEEVSNAIVDRQFKKRDKNQDGRIALDELPTHASGVGGSLFRSADANGDGSVNHDEARAFGHSHGIGRRFMSEADENGDGYLSRSEAKPFYEARNGPFK